MNHVLACSAMNKFSPGLANIGKVSPCKIIIIKQNNYNKANWINVNNGRVTFEFDD